MIYDSIYIFHDFKINNFHIQFDSRKTIFWDSWLKHGISGYALMKEKNELHARPKETKNWTPSKNKEKNLFQSKMS